MLLIEFLISLKLPIAILLLTKALFIDQFVLGDYFAEDIFILILLTHFALKPTL